MNLIEAFDLQRRHGVAIAGSGGKTSLVLRLASELRAAGKRAAVTCTTRMRTSEVLPEADVCLSARPERLRRFMEETFDAGRVPFLFAGREGRKHVGLPPSAVDRLAGVADALIVEADGARGLPLKIPRDGEPVLPASADRYAVVVGAGALGRKAGDDTVFHLEGAGSRLVSGDPLTPEAVASLVQAPGGYLRFATGGRRTFLVVNQADAAEAGSLEALVRKLGHGAVERILAGSASRPDVPFEVFDNRAHRVVAILLAAGGSSRFGGSKLCVDVRGTPMIRRAAEASRAPGVEKTIVVVGHGKEKVRETLAGVPGLEIVDHPDFAQGMSSSLKRALERAAGFDACLVLLGDLPFVDAGLVGRVVEAYRASTTPLCFPRVEGRQGHPVLFRRDLWPGVMACAGDEGGRSVVRRFEARARVLEGVDPRTQIDVDTPEDARRVEGYNDR